MKKNENEFHKVKLKKNKSIIKAIQILDLLASTSKGFYLSEISSKLNINKATTLRLLKTLEDEEFVERKGNLYFLGMRLFSIGNKVPIKRNIIDRVHPHLVKLAYKFNETANLAELCFGSVDYLDKIETPRSLRISTYIGAKLPIHCTALGKAIMAFLPKEKREVILQDFYFERKTKNTITDKKAFEEELKKIEKKGYSIDNEEFEEGLRCVAVPLFIEDLNFYGAISLSAPSQRLPMEMIPEVAEVLKKEAELIEKEIKIKKI